MCDDREKLIAYLYDEASATERRQVDAHLAGCEECREELRGFRSVRQDLLAWDVPEHGSVWKPFVTPQPALWWKQVPAWGYAAAATLIFGIGLAGGFAARALATPAPIVGITAQTQTQPSMTAAATNATPQTIAATPEQVRALEERLASIERVALTSSASPRGNVEPTGHVPLETGQSVVLTRAELDQILKESEGRINERTARKLVSMMVDMEKQRSRDMATVTQQINEAQQLTNANLVRVATRGTPEKEKEQ